MHLEIILIAFSLTFDTFFISLGYYFNKIKIPFFSKFLISIISTIFFAFSIFIGYIFDNIFSQNFLKYFSFSILLLVGIIKIFSEIIKLWLSKKIKQEKPLSFKIFDFKLILNIFTDNKSADLDENKVISPLEAISLSLMLSLDSIAIGLSASTFNYCTYIILPFTFIFTFLFLNLGFYFGKKIAKKNINLSWICGIIFIAIAVLKLL